MAHFNEQTKRLIVNVCWGERATLLPVLLAATIASSFWQLPQHAQANKLQMSGRQEPFASEGI